MNHLRMTAALLLAAVSVSSCAVAAFADGETKGDFNGDGVVNSNDALLTLHASIEPDILDYTDLDRVDINEDGVVDASDAVSILRMSIDLEDEGDEDSDTVQFDQEDEPEQTDTYEQTPTFTQVSDMKGWSAAEVVEAVGPLFTEDQRKTGILASVSMAQFIVESGYGQSKLSLEANNCFGIKGWQESTPRVDCPWDGVSVYVISTKEYDSYGNSYYVDASFRKYACMEDSIADHSRVLITSTDGSKLRYEGVVGCTDYRKAAQIIKNGGYATSPDYVDLLCSVIEYWDLTQYDLKNASTSTITYTTPTAGKTDSNKCFYRVRTDWSDASTQIGAFLTLDYAKACADNNPGYNVYDEDGNVVYSS